VAKVLVGFRVRQAVQGAIHVPAEAVYYQGDTACLQYPIELRVSDHTAQRQQHSKSKRA
jgi:hypothetical protein